MQSGYVGDVTQIAAQSQADIHAEVKSTPVIGRGKHRRFGVGTDRQVGRLRGNST
jgi:hypothetical protein